VVAERGGLVIVWCARVGDGEATIFLLDRWCVMFLFGCSLAGNLIYL
jgi:hypothetical protein